MALRQTIFTLRRRAHGRRGRVATAPGMAPAVVLAALLWACVLVLGGCDSEPAVKVDLSKRREIMVRERAGELTYAYLPQYSHAVSYQRHHLLVEYLAETTGLRLRQIFPDTFDEHLNMLVQGRMDISFSNPFIYVKAADRGAARAFARVMEPSGRNFRGQIICRADDEGIEALDDVRGKRWIAVDPSSAGGYLFALGHFLEHGIHASDFAQVAFAPGPGGKQEKVVLSVASGEFDVGSIREGTLDVAKDKVDLSRIRVLAFTRWYPGWVYSVRAGLDPDIVRKLRDALAALTPDNPLYRPILENAGFTGVIPSTDQDFDPVRALAALVAREQAR